MFFSTSGTALQRPRPLSRQAGAIAIIVGLSIVVLVGFVGLALDTGKLYVAKTELQTSADACALAAAQALGGANPLAVAEAAGMAAGRTNNVLFQAEPVAFRENDSVRFSTTLNGAYETKDTISAAAARYVRCTVERPRIPTWLIHVLNAVPGVDIQTNTVRAAAVAARVAAQTNCALPVAICSTALSSAPPPGTWVEGVIGPSGGQNNGQGGLTGNFKWVDFTPPGGGANELGQILTGPGTCNLPAVGTEVGEPGAMASLSKEWNSRFGIYQGNVRPDSATPDFSGYAYTEVNWPSRFNAYADFRSRRASNAAYQGDGATGLKTQGSVSNSTFLAQNGADRRLAIAPVVDCAGFASGSTAPVVDWACVLMLHPLSQGSGGGATGSKRMYLEYLGKSSDAGSPCASLGVPGQGGGVSQGPQVPALYQ